MMGPSYKCYIPSFVEIGPLVLENKILKGFLTIYGRGGHLGHVTNIILININFLVHVSKRLHATSNTIK